MSNFKDDFTQGTIERRKRPRIAFHIHVSVMGYNEKASTVIKAKVVRTDQTGFGCQFVDLSPAIIDLLEKNFDIYSATHPIE